MGYQSKMCDGAVDEKVELLPTVTYVVNAIIRHFKLGLHVPTY